MTDLNDYELLDYLSFAIQEALAGNVGELDNALYIVETMRDRESSE